MKSLIDPVVALAEKAGQAILEVYSSDFEVQSKNDESPLTQADLASHHCIVAGLEKLTPGMPVISEESGLPDFEERSQLDALLADRSAGRHQGIRQSQWRVHRQHRLDRQSTARVRRGACTGTE